MSRRHSIALTRLAARCAITTVALVASAAFAGVPEGAKTEATPEINWAKEQQFWSFHAPLPQAVPAVKDSRWPRQRLDSFILARLEHNGLTPSPEADKATLLRRVTFDLTGLPPTPEETKAFLNDKRRDAYERLVDRLLASPAFGERMASLWLPLVRYAEDQAHQVGADSTMFYPNAFRYRDWVVQAFNRDLPYDRFIKLQLAADREAGARPEDQAALGFVGLGPKYYNRGRLEVMADEWEDRVDTVSRCFLGLTVACARCHDHKFDPITMQDYYGLAGVFASSKMVNRTSDGKPLEGKLNADKMPMDVLHIVEDGSVTNLNIFLRGNVDNKGPLVERRFLRILSNGEPVPFHEGSGRKELADAIASRTNPLTGRVMANRMWGWFFGKPLVPTPSNFGHSGQAPMYQELLDDVAVRFMDEGWSMKQLAREMVLSATYRQSSHSDSKKAAVDAANDQFWRMNRRRLSVEQWRDSILSVSGQLQPAEGRSLELDDPNNLHRTLYARISRLKLNDLLMQLDYPDANVHAEKRAVTTTPMQKLFMLNSPFMQQQAQELVARLAKDAGTNDKKRIQRAYQLLYSREPESTELKLALEFLRQPDTASQSRWEQYAQMLLAANEMMYLD